MALSVIIGLELLSKWVSGAVELRGAVAHTTKILVYVYFAIIF